MGQADHIPLNFLKAVFHKPNLVHSCTLCPKYSYPSFTNSLWCLVIPVSSLAALNFSKCFNIGSLRCPYAAEVVSHSLKAWTNVKHCLTSPVQYVMLPISRSILCFVVSAKINDYQNQKYMKSIRFTKGFYRFTEGFTVLIRDMWISRFCWLIHVWCFVRFVTICMVWKT